MKKNIMVFYAHGDDVELEAGGTLAKYLDSGYTGCYVIATNSNSGFNVGPRGQQFTYSEEISEKRRKEIHAAAAVFGLEPTILNFKEHLYTTQDGERLYADIKEFKFKDVPPTGRVPIVVAPRIPEIVDEVEKLFLEYEPEITLTHPPDANPDHYCTMLLACNAFRQAARKVSLGTIYMTAPWTTSFLPLKKPDFYVDVTDYIDKNLEALSKHKSQCEHAAGDPRMRKRLGKWGEKIGAEYAEAFYRCRKGLMIAPTHPCWSIRAFSMLRR